MTQEPHIELSHENIPHPRNVLTEVLKTADRLLGEKKETDPFDMINRDFIVMSLLLLKGREGSMHLDSNTYPIDISELMKDVAQFLNISHEENEHLMTTLGALSVDGPEKYEAHLGAKLIGNKNPIHELRTKVLEALKSGSSTGDLYGTYVLSKN